MKTNWFYNSKITSDITNIRSVIDEILGKLINLSCVNNEVEAIYDIKVILNELIINAIKHGNKYDYDKFVKVSAAFVNDEYILFIIEDEGEGYCYSDLELSNISSDPIDCCSFFEGGRGLMIVNCLCEKIKFNKKGNKIIVLKKLFIDNQI
ncbi:MAG: ATP-binding protein [Bacillota bacterium]|nr:ATP-binding protein [Bacillota bacterium]